MGRPRSFNETVILEQAMKVFWQNGYFHTSIEMLTTGMRINRFSLYATFGSKDELFTRALRNYREQVISGLISALEGAVRKDQIDQATDVKGTASYLFGLLLGFSVYAKCAPDVPALRAYLDQGLGPLTVDVAGR